MKVLIWLVFLCFYLLYIWLLVLVITVLVHDPKLRYLAVVVYMKTLFWVVESTGVAWDEVKFSGFINCLLSEVCRHRINSLSRIEFFDVMIFLLWVIMLSKLLHCMVSLFKGIRASSLIKQLLVKMLTAISRKIHPVIGSIHAWMFVSTVVLVVQVYKLLSKMDGVKACPVILSSFKLLLPKHIYKVLLIVIVVLGSNRSHVIISFSLLKFDRIVSGAKSIFRDVITTSGNFDKILTS